MHTGGLLQELVRFLDDRVSLLVFLPDVQQADSRIIAAQHVARVHGAQVREAHQLAGIAVHVRAAIDHEDRLTCARKQRPDGGALDAGVQAQQQGGGGQHGAGVAGGNERVRLVLFL